MQYHYLEKPQWHHLYTLLVTPKGNNVKHKDYTGHLLGIISSIRSVKYCFLVAESENTDHYHGIIATKQACKFSKLTRKSNPYVAKISSFYSNLKTFDFFTYMVKHNPTSYYKYEETKPAFIQLDY